MGCSSGPILATCSLLRSAMCMETWQSVWAKKAGGDALKTSGALNKCVLSERADHGDAGTGISPWASAPGKP